MSRLEHNFEIQKRNLERDVERLEKTGQKAQETKAIQKEELDKALMRQHKLQTVIHTIMNERTDTPGMLLCVLIIMYKFRMSQAMSLACLWSEVLSTCKHAHDQ